MSRSQLHCHVGTAGSGRAGVEWGPGLRAGQEVLPCEDRSVRGGGDPAQQAASKSVRPAGGRRRPNNQHLANPRLVCGIPSEKGQLSRGPMWLCQLLRHSEFMFVTKVCLGFPGGSDGKEPACNAGNPSSLGREDPLEKEMATHSSILARRIPWTEEPGGPQSMGSQRVGCT